MASQYVNWKLIIVLLLAGCVLVLSAFGLRKWQQNRMAYDALQAGLKAYDQSQWPQAARQLGIYIQASPDDKDILMKYAQSQINIRPLRQNNLKQALAAYHTILQIERTNLDAALNLCEIYLQLNQPTETERIAERFLADQTSPTLSRLLVRALVARQQFQTAAQKLQTLINEYPKDVASYELYYQFIRQYPEQFTQNAKAICELAVANNPQSAYAYIIRGRYYIENSQPDQAYNDFQTAKQKNFTELSVRLKLAEQFIRLNEFEQANAQLQIVQENDPESDILWLMKAQLVMKTEDPNEMEQTAQNALESLKPDFWDFMPTAAELYIKARQFEEAQACLDQLKEKEIAPAMTTFLQGLLEDRNDNPYKAIQYWYEALRQTSDTEDMRMMIASKLIALGDKQSAVQQLQMLLSQYPDNIAARIELARLLADLQNYTEAITQIETAQQRSPDNLNIRLLTLQIKIKALESNNTDIQSPLWSQLQNQLRHIESQIGETLQTRLLHIELMLQQHYYTQAQDMVARLKNEYPDILEPRQAAIRLDIKQQNYSQALEQLQQLIREYPDQLSLYQQMVRLFDLQNNPEQCETTLQNHIKTAVNLHVKRELGLLLSQCYRVWGKPQKRYQLLLNLSDSFANDIQINRQLLTCPPIQKDTERAQALIDKIKSVEGENGWQWRYEQARYWLIQESFHQKIANIISLLKTNLDLNPDDQKSRMLLAAAYRKAGQIELAVTIYKDAYLRDPDEMSIIIPYVAILYQANKFDQANDILQQVGQQSIYNFDLTRLMLQNYFKHGRLKNASQIIEDILRTDPNSPSGLLAKGLLKMEQQQFDDAQTIFTKLKSIDPNSMAAYVTEIELNIRSDNLIEARSLAEQLVDRFNNTDSYIIRSKIYALSGQMDKAKEDIQFLIQKEPDNPNVWIAKSELDYNQIAYSQTVESIEKALALDPQNPYIAKRAIAIFLKTESHRERALQLIQNAIERFPDNYEFRIIHAHLLFQGGQAQQVKQAMKTLEELTDQHPQLPSAWQLWAQMVLSQGDPSKALDITLQGLVHNPGHQPLLLLKAQCESHRSPALAIPTLKALYEINPDDLEIIKNLAQTYIKAGQSQKAIHLLNKHINEYNDLERYQLECVKIQALYQQGDSQQARQLTHRLMKEYPGYTDAYQDYLKMLIQFEKNDTLAEEIQQWYLQQSNTIESALQIARFLLQNNNTLDAARILITDLISKYPHNTEVLYHYANLLLRTQQYETCISIYEKILITKPLHADVLNNLAWVLSDNLGQHEKAMMYIQKAVSTSPESPDVIDTRGIIYHHLEQYDLAIKDFQKAISLYPIHSTALAASYLHLANTYYQINQFDKAIEAADQAAYFQSRNGGLMDNQKEQLRNLQKALSIDPK